MEGRSSPKYSASSASTRSEFSDWVCKNGGNDEIVRILNDHGFSSKLSLRHLDLESSDAKSMVEKLNYGQKCFVQGLVRLCEETHKDPKANPYTFGIGKAHSLGSKAKSGTLREKLNKVFHFSGKNGSESSNSKVATEPSSQPTTDDEFIPVPSYPRKRKSKHSGSQVVGKGKGSSKPAKKKVKEQKLKVVALPKATSCIPPRWQREKYTKDVWVRVTALDKEVERKIQEAFGWRTSEIPQYMYAQGKNLRVATLSDVDGAESWDFESVRALMGGGSLYIVKQVSCVSSTDSDSHSAQSVEATTVLQEVGFRYISIDVCLVENYLLWCVRWAISISVPFYGYFSVLGLGGIRH